MSILVGFIILAMVLLIGYMAYRLIKTRSLLVLVSLCLQLFSVTIAASGFVKKVQSSNLAEGGYILFGIVVPAVFLLHDYIRMIRKVKKQGVYSGLVEAVRRGRQSGASSSALLERIRSIREDVKVSELADELKVHADEMTRSIKNLLQRVHDNMKENDLENAYRTYDILLNLIRNSPCLFYNYGNINYRMGHYEEAVINYRKALDLLSTWTLEGLDVRIHFNAANAQIKLGHYEEAVEHCRKCIEKQPELYDAYENIALGLSAAGRVKEAVDYLKRLEEKQGPSDHLHFLAGSLYQSVNDDGKAADEFRACVRLKPEHAEAYEALGKVCIRLRLFEEAEDVYKKLISLKPEDYKGLYSLGTALYHQGRQREAIEVFDKVIELNPRSAGSYYNMAMAYEDLHEYDKAIDAYKAAIRTKEDMIEAYNNLGILLSTRGRNYEALEVYSAGLGKNPGEYSLYYNTGITLSNMGRNADAEAAFRKALERKPEEHEIKYHLAGVLMEMKKYAEAVECYKSVLLHKPQDSELFYGLATVYSMLKKHDIALDNLKKAIELNRELKDTARREIAFNALKSLTDFKELVG